jgi:photosystem II stability/assembly factor-like uncharacterized protein
VRGRGIQRGRQNPRTFASIQDGNAQECPKPGPPEVPVVTRFCPAHLLGKWQKVLLAAAALSLVPLASAQKASRSRPSGQPPDSAQLIRLRARWFYRQRAYPLPRIPAFARLRALEQLRQMLKQPKATNSLPFSPSTLVAGADPAWTLIGPQPTNSPIFAPFISGRVTAMAVDPTNSNIVYLGAAEGGVWKTTDGGSTWTPLTDQEPSLAVGSLAIDPSSCSPGPCTTIYVGTGEENFAIDSYYGVGVLKSTNGGSTWTQECSFGSFSCSQPLDVNRAGPMIGAIAVDPANSQILLASVQGSGSALQSGVWRSTDGGTSWTHVLPTPIRIVSTDVVFDPSDATGQTAYAGLTNLGDPNVTSGSNGVYKSINAGQTWTQLTLPASSSSMGRIALGIGPHVTGQTAGELFAAIADATSFSNNLLGVFKSTNGGTTWSQLSSTLVSPSGGFCNPQCFYDLVIHVSPANPSVIFAGGAGGPAEGENATLIRSLNGGSTWTEVSNNGTSTGLHPDVHALAFSSNGSSLYVGNDGGGWKTTNTTATTITWADLNNTLAIAQFYPGLSAHPSDPAFRSFGGTQDNGTQRYSGILAWDDTLACGDGSATAIDLLTPSTVYATCAFIPGLFFALEKSLLNGDSTSSSTTFFFAENGINFFDNGNFIPPLVMDPENTQTLYFGTFRLWQTVDGGNSWSAISPDLTGGCSGDGLDCISTIAVAPTDANTILVGTGNAKTTTGTVNAVSLTTSGGVSWTDVSTGLPPRFVTRVAVDPHSATTLYATFSGFSGFVDSQGHVFQGHLVAGPSVAWTDISSSASCPSGIPGPLPNIPVNDIVIDPDIPAGRLYVATDIGVFQGDLQAGGTGGACWQPLGSSLPLVAVVSLELHHASRTLLAASHGRSVWELALGGLPAFSLGTISPASDNAGDPNSLGLTLTGTGFTVSSVARFNGSNLATTFVSATKLTAVIPSSDLATSQVAQIEVFDSSHSPNITNSLPFTLTSQTPVVTSISPTSSTAPAASNLSLTVNGSNFVPNTSVELTQLSPFPSSCIATSFVSASKLTATIQKSCLQFGGTFFVTANTPSPGGGSSNPNFDPSVCCSLVVTGPVPANDNFANAAVVNSGSFSRTEDTSGATVESSDPSPPCVAGEGAVDNGTAKSVWFSFTAGGNGTLEADTIGSAYDTILSVWKGTAGSLTNVACNDDIVLGVNRVSQLNISVSSGTAYFFLVTAFVGDGGKLVFNLNTAVPPGAVFTASASSVSPSTIAAGANASFTLTLTPEAGSNSGSVTLEPCTASPPTSTITCSYSPNPVSLGTSAATSTVKIMTVARSATAPFPFNVPPAWPLRILPGVLLAGMLAALALGCRARRKRLALGLAFGLVFAALVFQTACGGGGGGGAVVTGTQAGTYTITVPSSPPAQNGPASVKLTVQ